MKYCSKCKKAIESGDVCTSCGEEIGVPENINIATYLVTACGFEKDRVKAALTDAMIPFTEKAENKEIYSEVISGGNACNEEIFVPFSAYNKARRALIDIGVAEPTELELQQDDEPDSEKETDDSNRPHETTRAEMLVLMLIVLLLVAVAVMFTDTITGFVKNLF